MNNQQIISWLLTGDVSIQYQVHRDLLGEDRADLQTRIELEGWGQRFLSKRKSNGQWGSGFYQPKWTSSHYTLLDLRHLGLSPTNKIIKETIGLILDTCKASDGGIQLGPSTSARSDICVNGMFLNYASYFGTEGKALHAIVDCILDEVMPDGGFNCQSNRKGARHSSLHTTLSVLEGLFEFQKSGHAYRKNEVNRARKSGEHFVLLHRLFLSDRTGAIINQDFLKLRYPCRWKYDILRALDYFQNTGSKWDESMKPAILVIQQKRRPDGRWNLQAAHPGQVHFAMEKAGEPSRWNTLRALRVLKHFGIEQIGT